MIKGWRIAQAGPSTVCLYRTEMSRQIRKASSSRCDHISLQSMPIHPERGRITSSGVSASSPTGGGKVVRTTAGSPRCTDDGEINESSVFDHGGSTVLLELKRRLASRRTRAERTDSSRLSFKRATDSGIAAVAAGSHFGGVEAMTCVAVIRLHCRRTRRSCCALPGSRPREL